MDLKQLAERIAGELARREWKGEAESAAATRGAPPEKHDTASHAELQHHSHAAAIVSPRSELRAAVLSPPPGVTFVRAEARIADFIDHTLLKPEATRGEIDTLCDEALEQRFAAVCVHPVWVSRCAERLRGSEVAVATVIGFPLGASHSETKAFEASLAVRHGATELDMVAAIGHIKSGDWGYVADDIDAVVRGGEGRLVKVIIESAALTPVEIIKVCALAREAGAHYVKTSTGFHAAGGASAEAVALMRLVVADALGVKASGGVRDCATALRMIANGATRIGTSSGVGMASCLGPGPLPMRELLDVAQQHAGRCSNGACAVETPSTAPAGARAY